uniref:Ig-like domain-containing protein n=1 Tax=Podarcis muralis TaxID=64176 RepID=A0A670II94_PODMU
ALLPMFLLSLQSQHPGYELKALKAVTVQRGLCVHIPCNFTYPTSQYSGELYVYWIKNDRAGSYIGNIWHPNAGSVVASSDKDQSIASFAGNRFQLTGNLSEGDCSFSINDVQNQDEGQYYFRIEKGPILKFSYHLYILPHVSVTGKRGERLCLQICLDLWTLSKKQAMLQLMVSFGEKQILNLSLGQWFPVRSPLTPGGSAEYTQGLRGPIPCLPSPTHFLHSISQILWSVLVLRNFFQYIA